MYTVVLMAAMSAGEANPQWLFNHGCCNSYGSCSCYCSCGGGFIGHHGCGGCCGGGWGCCGGCYGGSYAGTPFMGICAGSHWDGAPCYGSYGCMGPGYAGGCYASAGYAAGWPGAYGSCYGYGGGYGGLTSFTCGGNYGCYGGYACYGIPTATEGGVIVDPNVPHSIAPVVPSTTPAPVPMGNPPPPKASLENKVRSRVIIETPENAKLYVDGQLMQTASSHRVFQTPELAPGSTYFYDLKIEVVREGKTLTEEKRIYVRPGIEQSVAFSTPAGRSDIATVSTGRE